MFNSLSKRLKGDTPQSQPKISQEIEGFICPICMASFNTPDLVQKHFDNNHNDLDSKKAPTSNILSPSVERKESIQNIQENLNDLKQSLDEEIWFNKELQKECGRLNNMLKEKDEEAKIQNQVIEAHSKTQLELKEINATLKEELEKFRIGSDYLVEENKRVRSDLQLLEDKNLSMTDSQQEMKEVIERQQSEIEVLTNQLSTSSPNTDSNDFAEEVNEITEKYKTSEILIQHLKSENERFSRENENLALEFHEQCELLKNQITHFETENSNSSVENNQKIADLCSQLESRKLENEELCKNLNAANKALMQNEDKIIHMKRSWSNDQTTLENALLKLEEINTDREKFKIQNQELTSKIKNRDQEMQHLQSGASQQQEEAKLMDKNNKLLTEELNNMKRILENEKNEKNRLQSEVQMTDAANLVMEQLRSENKTLQETIDNVKNQLEDEIKTHNVDLSALRAEIQSQTEKIFDLNSSISEKNDLLEEATKKNVEMCNVNEKCSKKLECEVTLRSEQEDKLVAYSRDLKSKEESFSALNGCYKTLKDEYDKSIKNQELTEANFNSKISSLNSLLDIAKLDTNKVVLLQKEIELKNSELKSSEMDLKVKNQELTSLSNVVADLQETIQNLQKDVNSRDSKISNFQSLISEKDLRIKSCEVERKEYESKIEDLNQQLKVDRETLLKQEQELSSTALSNSKLKEENTLYNNNIQSLTNEMKNLTSNIGSLNDENSSLKTEISIIKKDLLNKEDLLASMVEKNQSIEKELTEKNQSLETLQNNYGVLEKKKFDTMEELLLSKSQLNSLQDIHSELLRQQNECQNNLDSATAALQNSEKNRKIFEEQLKNDQAEHQKEIDCMKKEEVQLKNHVKALTKTLNESSENYTQERLEATEKILSITTQNDELILKLGNLQKSLQRTDEDLESEKNLRESERNNMTKKISELTEQLSTSEQARLEIEQRFEVVESENIENKLRLELFNEEKDKLLEKIIQVENSLKKQNDSYVKKCKEFDQLQSAILDLGRENQSLQISKEKLTNRQWVVDVDAVDCFTCRKSFSLTSRKHHCRSCGQVYCQDCSSKSASLAVSRKPVRVCDACYVELQSHRRNSGASSSNISLQL